MIIKVNAGSCGNQIQNKKSRDNRNGKSRATKRLRGHGACGAMCPKGPLVVNEAFYVLTCTNEVEATMWRLSANVASMSGVRPGKLPVTAGIETPGHCHWAIVLIPTT